MYISRMPLNTARYAAKQLIASPYRLHAAVEKSFPPGAVRSGDGGRILWRLDFSREGDSTWLYVVSPERPDFTNIVEQAGWPTHAEWEVKDYEPLITHIAKGQEWAFRLRANPARQVYVDKGRRSNHAVVGKVMGHVTADYQLSWLEKHSERNGFALLGSSDEGHGPSCLVSQRRKEQFDHGGSKVTLVTAQFDGQLRVTDAQAFQRCLRQGIGRAKSFGCGLLTVAPIR